MSSTIALPAATPVPTRDITDSPYNYVPTRSVAIIFIVLFSISSVAHLVQCLKYRMYWVLYTIFLCGTLEILGWSGRLWSSWSPFLDSPFQIQITTTIIAPTPLLAASFIIFGSVIRQLGPQFSRLAIKWYTIIFCTADVVSLVVQGVGGGMAASADTLEGANKGAHIMLGGIVFQLVVMVVFSICMAEFFYRYLTNSPLTPNQILGGASLSEKFPRTASIQAIEGVKPGKLTKGLMLMSWALVFSTLFLFIRSIYRTIELSGGWNGPIISDQLLFNVLDGAMVILAIYTINIFHPGMLIPEEGGEPKGRTTGAGVA